MDTFPMTAARGARGWIVALVLTCLSGGVLADDPQKPQVGVTFEIEAAKFERNLPEQEQLRADLAARVAAEFGRRYRFADWLAEGATDPSRRIGVLTARLVEIAASPGPEIAVKWLARFGGAAAQELDLPPIQIYSPTNPDRETNDRPAFVSYVSQRVLPQIRADGFQRQALRQVVQKLSIASSVDPQSAERVIVIPRMWRHLQLGQESTLLLVFSKGTGTDEVQGKLDLVLPSQRPNSPGVGFLQAAVSAASFGTQALPLTSGWHERLPVLMDGARVACFIRTYRPVDELAGSPIAIRPD